MHRFMTQLLILCALFVFGNVTSASALTKCRMTYELKTWSVIFKTSRGTGHIKCSNGQAAEVNLVAYGGGPTLGYGTVVNGKGDFSEVENISDLYGGYAEAMAHAGAGASTDARAMFRGGASLSLSGRGNGINLGFAFGSFSIRPR